MTKFEIIFIFASMMLLFSCKTRIENTFPDANTISEKKSEKESSVINLPIEIPVKSLETEINRQFEGVIYKDESYDSPEKDDVMIKIWKTRDIKIQGYNEFLKFDVPIKIWASYRWKACDICPNIEKSTNFDITVSFTSKLKLNPDWTFQTQTVPSGLNFESKPKLDFGVVSIPITTIVEPIVKDQLVEVCKEIDMEVASSFNFSKEIDFVWKEMHEPQLIDSTYKVWLKMTPQDIVMSPLKANNERIKLNVSFKSIFEIVVGNKPPVIKVNRLPILKSAEISDKDFSFVIETFIDLNTASDIARIHLKDSVFELTKKKSVKIDDVSFLGIGDKIYAKVDLSRSINGSVFFVGTPVYDKTTNLIYLKDFDYDIKSKNVLIKSANWLLHGALKNKIEKEFNYSLTDDLKMIRNTVTEILSTYEFDNLFTLRGKLENLDIQDIIVENNNLRVIIICKGKAIMKIKSLEF